MNIVEYMESRGFKFKRKGKYLFTNSPFSNDSDPSFCVFPDGGFKDFSTGRAGNVVTLANHYGDTIKDFDRKVPPPPAIRGWDNSVPTIHTNLSDSEKLACKNYAASRGVVSGYIPAKVRVDDELRLSLLFVHQNAYGTITGGKFRLLEPVDGQRFTSRGTLGFYVLKNLVGGFEPPSLYVIEGEINGNSLWEYMKLNKRNGVVASIGGVGSVPKKLPFPFQGKLLIDFDGSQEKYDGRVKLFAHLGLTPVKMVLPKGEDFNSLWIKRQTNLVEGLV